MIGLLGELARDYGVTGQQVAWINGIGGALLTSAGALAAALIPVRIRAPIALILSGLANAATLAVFALGPMRPAIYIIGSVLYLLTVGACYPPSRESLWSSSGGSGKSGSARYAIINSLGNVPVVYMTWLDGRGYALWGPRGMPATDAIAVPTPPESCLRISSSAADTGRPRAGRLIDKPGMHGRDRKTRRLRRRRHASQRGRRRYSESFGSGRGTIGISGQDSQAGNYCARCCGRIGPIDPGLSPSRGIHAKIPDRFADVGRARGSQPAHTRRSSVVAGAAGGANACRASPPLS